MVHPHAPNARDSWGLARSERALGRALMVETEVVRGIVVICEAAAHDVDRASTDDDRRAAVTLLRVACDHLREAGRRVALHVEALRAVSRLRERAAPLGSATLADSMDARRRSSGRPKTESIS
jgi:hypothetical protein